MNNIKKKFLIGLLFSLFATVVSTLFKYYSDYLNLVMQNKENIGLNFLIFFLIGYVILGNLLATKKEA